MMHILSSMEPATLEINALLSVGHAYFQSKFRYQAHGHCPGGPEEGLYLFCFLGTVVHFLDHHSHGESEIVR